MLVGRRATAVHALDLVEVLFVKPQRHVGIAEQAHIAVAGAKVQHTGVVQADVQAGFQTELAAGSQLVQTADVQRERIHACGLQTIHVGRQFAVGPLRDTGEVGLTERERDIGVRQQSRQTAVLTQPQQARAAMRRDVSSNKVESVVVEVQHLARRHPFAIQRLNPIDARVLALQVGEREGFVAADEGDGDHLLGAVCRHSDEAVAVGEAGFQVDVARVERVGPAAVLVEREVAVALFALGLFLHDKCVVGAIHVV